MAGKVIALAKMIATNSRSAHIDVFFTGKIAARAQEAIAIGKHIKDTADLFKALGLHAGSKHCFDELCLLKALEVDLQLLSLFAKLNNLKLRKIFLGNLRSNWLTTVLLMLATVVMVTVVLLAVATIALLTIAAPLLTGLTLATALMVVALFAFAGTLFLGSIRGIRRFRRLLLFRRFRRSCFLLCLKAVKKRFLSQRKNLWKLS